MSLTPGTSLGPYEIVSAIGSGGMGDVYRARDTKLNRDVAIKVLSDEVADDSARRRFQREAQTASSLNHPHILTVHDVGEFDGRQYFVTELVDGGTLAAWTRSHRRSWRQVVELLVGVADGLATAHAAGILHRDIKPENVLVSTTGYAKLADFGIAKLNERAVGAATTQTITAADTRRGAVIGTVPYMSPEGQWVLVVEMLRAWQPCQLVRFDGGSPRRTVGPPSAPCTDANWSPDGTWMYFSANAGDGFHIWRQRFPNGNPEQVTSGVTEEQGLSFFADGRSFVTSIGVEQNTVWLHTTAGDRQITSQAYAYQPKLSADGKHLYYMLRSGVARRTWVSAELWVTDLDTGQRQRLFPAYLVEDYSISADGSRVVFSQLVENGPSPLWIASLEAGVPPQRLGGAFSSRPVFGPNGDVFFVDGDLADGTFMYRIRPDGTGRQKASPEPARFLYDISPDGRWAAAWMKDTGVGIYPLDGGPPIELCPLCGTVGAENRGVTPPVVNWSRDGKYVYLHSAWSTRETYAIPLKPGTMLPPLPAGGLRSIQDIAQLPGAQRLDQLRAFQCGDPSVYAFMKVTSQRNIYRVPVPE